MILDLPLKPISWLKDNIQKLNIADQFDENTLNSIGAELVSLVASDKSSRQDWIDSCEKGIKLAKQVIEKKSFPWDKSANTKDPLIAVAMMQFAARSGAEIVRGRDVVKSQVTGNDPDGLKEDRSKRISVAMSYQCLDEMTDWEADTDQLLSCVSGFGMYYKKTYFDTLLNRANSCSISPLKVIVNENIRSLESAERVTHEIEFSRNEVVERVRSGLWLDISDKFDNDDDINPETFYEVHCTLDLDGDGYKEPYLVVVHVNSGAVARIFCRYREKEILENNGEVVKIEPVHYFTEFPFLPSPDGKFHKLGFYQLLGPLNEEINTIKNQLIDSGTLANTPPIFVGKGARLPGGNFKAAPGKFIPVESTGQSLKDNIFIPQLAGPSNVLMTLLTGLDDKGMRLASVSETMMGGEPNSNVPATTTLAILDQGLKVFTSVLKRLFRAFKSEYKKIYKLNYTYLTDDKYEKIIDLMPEELQKLGVQIVPGGRQLVEIDFNPDDCDVQPIMDPTAASEAIRLARANAIYQADPQNPEIKKYYYHALGIPEAMINKFVPADQGPNPVMIKLQADITEMQQKGHIALEQIRIKERELAVKELDYSYKMALLESQAVLNESKTQLTLAQADATQVQMHIDGFQAQVDHLNQQFQQKIETLRLQMEGKANETAGSQDDIGTESEPGGNSGVVSQQDNKEGVGVSGSQGTGNNPDMAGGGIPSELAGGNGTMDTNFSGSMSRDELSPQPNRFYT